MADRVKGITVVLGGDTTGLNKALAGTNKEIKNTQSQLKDVERLLKLDPTNTQLLEQRQRLLADAVGETKTKLDTLKEAEKQVQEQFKRGEVSQQQYDALQREIVATEQELKRLEDQADKSNTAVSKIGDAAGKVKAGAGTVKQAFAPVTAAVAGLAGAAVATIPATEELRSDLSKLDASAEDNAVSAEAARDAWREFAVQSGETDSAVEATANLLQAGFTESNLQKAVEGLAGAAQRFPDTLKIEGLADSLQETLATGKATGQFGELLDRLGVGAENFTEQLALCGTEAEKQNLALETLANAGLNDSYNAWKANNEEMLANQEANLELQESMAELAEVVLPFVTEFVKKAAELISWFANLDSGTQTLIAVFAGLLAAISPIAGAIKGVTTIISFMTTSGFPALSKAIGVISKTVLPGLANAFTSVFSFIAANPVVLLIGAIVALVALIATKGDEIQAVLQKVDDFLQNIFATDWREIFGPVLGEYLNAFFANVQNIWNAIMRIFNGVIDFIRGVFTGDWERAWQGIQDIFGGIFDGLLALAKMPLNGIIGLLNMAINGINDLIRGFNGIGFDMPDWLGGGSWHPNIPTIPNIPYLAKGGTVLSGSAIVGEAGPELLTVGPGGTRVQPLTGNATNTTNLGGVSITVYGAPGQNVNELANIIMDKIEFATTRKGAVFGA